MDSGLRRNDGGSVTGFGWRNAIQIPAFAGMTGGAGMTAVGAGMGERRGNDGREYGARK